MRLIIELSNETKTKGRSEKVLTKTLLESFHEITADMADDIGNELDALKYFIQRKFGDR